MIQDIPPSDFFENGFFGRKIDYQLLEPASLIYAHATVLFLPAVVGVDNYPIILVDYSDGFSLA